MGVKARAHDYLLTHREFGPARVSLEVFASAVATTRARRPCRMRLEGEHWIHRYREGAAVTPATLPQIPPPAATSERMRDEFCHVREPHPGEVVIDVGAGVGEAELLFSSLVGPRGRVVAIEAHPDIYSCLVGLVAVNRLSNVETVNRAVTGETRRVTMGNQIEAEKAGEPGWYGNTIVAGSSEGVIEVEGTTLDHITAALNIGDIGLLKMNIEGAEGEALPGMEETVRRSRAAAIACHDFRVDERGVQAFRTKAAVRAFLERHGMTTMSRGQEMDPSVRDIVYGLRENASSGSAANARRS